MLVFLIAVPLVFITLIAPWLILILAPIAALAIGLLMIMVALRNSIVAKKRPIAFILCLEDRTRRSIQEQFKKLGFQVRIFSQPHLAIAQLLKGNWDLLAFDKGLSELVDIRKLTKCNSKRASAMSVNSNLKTIPYFGKEILLLPSFCEWEADS